MRVPHTIPINTLHAYAASEQTLMLMGERNRQLRAEDLSWDMGVPPTLAHMCVQSLVNNFESHSQVLHYLPQPDLDYLLEILPTDLSINITAPIIQDGIYWQRCCESRWSDQPLDVAKYSNSWKRMYLEKHLQEYICYQEPGYIDDEEIDELIQVCSPYVLRLDIKELKPGKNVSPNLSEECTHGELDPDHIDLSKVIANLLNLQELSIRFHVLRCGMSYNRSFFKVSLNDVSNISSGIKETQNLAIFKIHRCQIDDVRLNIMIVALTGCDTLELLEVSHCVISDIGAKSIAKLITMHKNLKSLMVPNNKIGTDGAIGLAFALQQPDSCPLTYLDLQFNLIKDKGADALATTLTKNHTLEELNLSGCGITDIGSDSLMDSLQFNMCLQRLILCNNHLGEEASPDIIKAVTSNSRIDTLDIRNCLLAIESETLINKIVAKNRTLLRMF